MNDGIELRHMRYFGALAAELHFGRAAESLGVSQPLLSRQIRELEKLAGVALLARTRPVVELTPAGVEFGAHARQTLRQAEATVRAAQRAAGEAVSVCIAFEPCSVFHGFARLAADSVRGMPELRLDIRELPVAEHANRLRSGEIDIAFSHRNESASDIEFASLGWEPLWAVLPAKHLRATRRKLELSALAGESFVFWRRALAPACHDYIREILASNGIDPAAIHLASDHRNALQMVSAGLGWAIAPECARRAGQRGIVFRPISTAQIEFGISYAKNTVGPHTQTLLRLFMRAG